MLRAQRLTKGRAELIDADDPRQPIVGHVRKINDKRFAWRVDHAGGFSGGPATSKRDAVRQASDARDFHEGALG